MRVAALDLGSNTSLLLIAEVSRDQITRVLHDETTITRLGQGVHAERRFHPDALERMDACLANYASTINANHCEAVVAVATSAARDVKNGADLLVLGKRYNIPIHIITGAREAELTFHGAICDRKTADGVAVVDVGGGSSEVIALQTGTARGCSVDVGSVRLTEMFVHSDPATADELARLRSHVDDAFAAATLPTNINEIVAVAGTPTTLAGLEQRIDFTEAKIHGYPMSLAKIDEWTERLAQLPIKERSTLPGMQPKRADVIVAGSVILGSAVRALGKNQVTVSTRGVRYGVALAWDRF